MHRLLTGYAQYYNRRHRRVGHLLQGRHKAILCQSERYLSELVRYIHLNPVRAGIVSRPEDYKYSSHRAYLGLEPAGIVDVDPVLRHFGASKEVARERYRKFVAAGIKLGHCEEFYVADEGRILRSDENRKIASLTPVPSIETATAAPPTSLTAAPSGTLSAPTITLSWTGTAHLKRTGH